MHIIWAKAEANHDWESTSKCHFRARTRSNWLHASHFWDRYGWLSWSRQCGQFVSNASWAIRSTYHYHTVLHSSPGAAVFGRDMLFDIPYLADWHKIRIRRQKLTDHNTACENACRVDYDYVVCGQIMICKDGILRKSEYRCDGPYTITQVHMNGTIRVQRRSK